MRVLFMGTPEYALPALEAVCALGAEVRVVTRPDAPRGRGHRPTPSPVAAWAQARGLPVDKPSGPLSAFRPQWEAWGPRVIWTAAYGRLLPGWLLELAPAGAYNLHASLLPRWRGANPIRCAIRAGDPETGVTLMKMDAGLDTGPVVDQIRVAIAPGTDAGQLTARLAQAAAELTRRWLPRLLAGDALPLVAQAALGATPTYAEKWGPEEEHLDFTRPAPEVARWVWSLAPEPGAYGWLTAGDEGRWRVKILEARPSPTAADDRWEAGLVREAGEAWLVGCGERTVLEVTAIKPVGRTRMSPGAFMRGARLRGPVRLT